LPLPLPLTTLALPNNLTSNLTRTSTHALAVNSLPDCSGEIERCSAMGGGRARVGNVMEMEMEGKEGEMVKRVTRVVCGMSVSWA